MNYTNNYPGYLSRMKNDDKLEIDSKKKNELSGLPPERCANPARCEFHQCLVMDLTGEHLHTVCKV